MENKKIRMIALGDELLAGRGDAKALGWWGRVLAQTPATVDLGAYALPCPGESTETLAQRWWSETALRLSEDHDNRLVLGLSAHDLHADISTPRSRLNLANILDEASRKKIALFVVGPPAGLDPRINAQLAELNAAFANVTTRRRHTYVDTFSPLLHHEQWREDLSQGNGLPRQAGYGLLAWLVLHRGWFPWLGVAPPQRP